jgi:hypothetical protein
MQTQKTLKPIIKNVSLYEDLLSINNELLRLATLNEIDPLMVHSLLGDYIHGMDALAVQRLYVMAGKAATLMDGTILELFKRPELAEVISELYFNNFQAPISLVSSIAAGPSGQLRTDAYSNKLRDNLVTRGVENLIAHEAFRTDAAPHLIEQLVVNTLQYTDNHQPALCFCESILGLVNKSTSGIDVIFLALKRLHPSGSDSSPASASPLLEWMKVNEGQLLAQMVNSKRESWMANELANIFHQNELVSLADRWYLRSGYLDFQRLYEINQRSGLKPDEVYLAQFIADDVKLSLKQVRDLLKYSLAVENLIPDADKWKSNLTWVTTSLVEAFSTFRKMGILPRSPEACEPLIGILSEHLKSGESMKPLMTKQIQPYIALSNSFKTKMFGIDLGL